MAIVDIESTNWKNSKLGICTLKIDNTLNINVYKPSKLINGKDYSNDLKLSVS